MARLSDWGLQKTKMRIEAANAKPERPRLNEQLGLEKSLVDMKKSLTEEDKQINNEMFNELNQKWKGNKGGSGGDAFVTGLTSGIKQGSFMDDKERQKKLIDFTEKMKDMVAQQNIKLFEAEKLDNARNSVTPRIMAYLNTYKNMSPNDRKVYLQSSMDEYNQAAGTDYKILDATGSEPWKVIVSDGQQSMPLDLMDFIKTPEEKKLEYYLNSNDVKRYEKSLANEDAMDQLSKNALTEYNRSRIEDAEIKRLEHQEARQFEKDIFEKTGDRVKFIDDMSVSGRNEAERHIKEYTERANEHLASEKRLTRAIQIAKEHPELFGNLNAIISARYHEDPGYILNILKKKIPKESMDAASELSGIIKNIFTGSIKGAGVGARAMNQFLEKKLEAGTPNQRWTANAFKKVAEEALKESSKDYEEEKKVADYGAQGLRYSPRAKSREKLPEISPNKLDTMSVDEKLKAIPGITEADIAEAKRRLKNGQ